MFDTMTATKIVGSLCGALLVFLLGKWAGELIYATGGGHGGDHAQGYLIETDEAHSSGDGDGGAGDVDLAALMAAADVDKGAKVFSKCKACHKLEDGANATGPYLYGVVGRDVGAAAGFGYSGKLVAVADVWTPQALSDFLENPKGFAPGTTMGFSGLKKPEDRANLIAYLDQTDGTTYEMAVPAAEEEASAEDAMTEEVAEEAETEMAATEEAASEASETEMAAAEENGTAETEMAAAEEDAPAEEAAGADASAFAAMVAEADVAKGEKVYKKCKACHSLEDGDNKVGPHLHNLIGRAVASVDGFKYSDAVSGLGGAWTADELGAFLEKPKDYAPGTKMSFAGLRKEEDRAAVIAYIQSAGQ